MVEVTEEDFKKSLHNCIVYTDSLLLGHDLYSDFNVTQTTTVISVNELLSASTILKLHIVKTESLIAGHRLNYMTRFSLFLLYVRS